jgi:hypothetical protein
MKENGNRPAKTKKTASRIFKNRLQKLRERGKGKGGLWLTAVEVARLRGIDVSLVSRHENHERPLTENDVTEYAKIYKVRPDQLFEGLTVKASA